MLLEKIVNQHTRPNEVEPRMIQVPTRHAGIVIDHDKALQLSTFYACVRVISEDIAALPWPVFVRKQGGGRQKVDNQVSKILNSRPNPEITAMAFRETIIQWALSWGNGYAEIARDMANRPAELYLISPDRVEVRRFEDRLIYEINNGRGPNTIIEAENMFHLHGIGFDGVVGYSLVSLAARSLGLSISLEEFGSAFFGNGAMLGGVIEIPKESTMTSEGKINLKKTFNEKHQGPSRAHGIEILDEGMKYNQLGVEPDHGQFIESRQHQVEEICRWMRVSPQKVAHLLRMTFNNVEQLSLDHVQDTLVPWITRLEQEADYKLFGQRNNVNYTKINTNALLRGDIASRTTFYREMWSLGVLSPNEIRELEDMNPVENGDKRFVMTNMTTLDKAGEDQPAPQIPATQPDEEQPDPAAIIEDRVLSILMREQNRFNAMIDRYPERQEYIDRVCGHLGSQRTHVAKTITSTLQEVLNIFGVNDCNVKEAAQIYSDMHVEQSRVDAIALYDGNDIDTKARAELITQKLLDSTILYAKANKLKR